MIYYSLSCECEAYVIHRIKQASSEMGALLHFKLEVKGRKDLCSPCLYLVYCFIEVKAGAYWTISWLSYLFFMQLLFGACVERL
jgi:hypothetical protein